MTQEQGLHEHPGGQMPHRHAPDDQMAIHDTTTGGNGPLAGVEREGSLELREEELQVYKRMVAAGDVVVRKRVVTETRTVEVPIQHEELVVERRAAATGGGGAKRPVAAHVHDLQPGETLRLTLREEDVVIQKRVVDVAEVTIGKRVVDETRHLDETVRREVPRVETEGDVVREAGSTTLDPGSRD